MKKFFLFAVALVGTMLAHAQISDGVSATLQAGETTTVFYGYDAFKDAITAAPTDIVGTITLSPGAFNNPGNISKSVKIYGAGFQPDTEKKISETRVVGDLNVVSTDDVTPTVRVEGIYMVGHLVFSGKQTISNAEFVKCSFGRFYNRIETANTIVRQSYIRERVCGEGHKATGLLVANCYIAGHVDTGFAAGSSIAIDHCIIADGYYGLGVAQYTNNIINPSHGYRIAAGATCYNNVSGDERLDVGGNTTCANNYSKSQWTDYKTLFADGQDNLNYTDTDGKPRTWVLAAPTTFVGTDGTPCGVTGGDYIWNPIPATPRIISTSVDAKSEAGKLKVTIKAEARPIE